ncbi:hypothetical protein V6N13_106311 [Hibiscus sabdariffa]|uniref:Uncharacterized protein n=1 Tax=Hibiscus sabdariffa TaxID=183260 RepID=A0ABR2F0D7_9ROSI
MEKPTILMYLYQLATPTCTNLKAIGAWELVYIKHYPAMVFNGNQNQKLFRAVSSSPLPVSSLTSIHRREVGNGERNAHGAAGII